MAECKTTSPEESHDTTMEDLIIRYHLDIQDCKRQITDEHIDEISRSHCREWRSLPSQLEMSTIVEHDIDCKQIDEDKKRCQFFKKWKDRYGSCATYESLIRALLKIKCVNDAESVCKLLAAPVTPAVSTNQSRCSPATASSVKGIFLVVLHAEDSKLVVHLQM